MLYSTQAKRNITRLIQKEKPDIAHLHNIYHQISPSIIDGLKNYRIPIVMTLHDFKLTCPVYTHLSHGEICEECRLGRYYKVVAKRCTKGSFTKSMVNMVEMYLHHHLLHLYEKIDLFISPSKFLIEKTQELGFKGNFVHLPNFVDTAQYNPAYEAKEKGIVYFGRLSEAKGLKTLLDAVKGLSVQLKIIGEGPQRNQLMQKIDQDKINNVTFLGFKQGAELQDEIKKSILVVLPSEWYENNPRSVIESFALGKPVIGSNIGGIPELVKEGETGYLFPPGNSNVLRDKIQQVILNRQDVSEMGRRARTFVENELNPDKHYQQLKKIYQQVLEKRQ